MPDLTVEDLVIEYLSDGYRVRAVDTLSMTAREGEIALLLGPSGSGKTSLLSALAGILTPASGRVRMGDIDVTGLRGGDLARYRRDRVGIVFQAFNLIPSATALENVAAPLLAAGRRWSVARTRAQTLLETVGMSEHASHRPGRLSGGQQQRIAVARALAHDPPLLLADEPTANLDYVNAESVVKLLRELRSEGRTIVVSTHDDRLTPIADQGIQMLPELRAADEGPRPVAYAQGEFVFHQGERGTLVYEIRSGRVEILRENADGSTEPLAILEAPQYFGELGPLLGFPRSAAARAITDVELTALSVRDFRERAATGNKAEQPTTRR